MVFCRVHYIKDQVMFTFNTLNADACRLAVCMCGKSICAILIVAWPTKCRKNNEFNTALYKQKYAYNTIQEVSKRHRQQLVELCLLTSVKFQGSTGTSVGTDKAMLSVPLVIFLLLLFFYFIFRPATTATRQFWNCQFSNLK